MPFVRAKCDRNDCLTTTDRRLLNQSDIILFHARDLDPDDLPPAGWRNPRQHFIFFNYESPVHTDLAKLRLHFNHYFNRTMTYRRDSDIVSLHPYGRVECLDRLKNPQCRDFPHRNDVTRQEKEPDWAQLLPTMPVDLTNKNRTVAWFVSNCHTDSRRELLVRNLSLYIPVDVYGDCPGGHKCQNRPQCDRMLGQFYRFYLSFENSLCPDYVTEKLYRALAHRTVPVVFGGADYSLYLPAGSYIDAREFSHPKQLADHLKRLMVDDDLYLKYFSWIDHYRVDPAPLDGWCQLCRLVDDLPKPKIYDDIAAWWAGRISNQSCTAPPPPLVSLDQEELTSGHGSSDYIKKVLNKLSR